MSNLTALIISAGIVVPMFYYMFFYKDKKAENKERELNRSLEDSSLYDADTGEKIPDDESERIATGFNKLHRAPVPNTYDTLPYLLRNLYGSLQLAENADFIQGIFEQTELKKQYPLATLNTLFVLKEDVYIGIVDVETGMQEPESFDFIVMGVITRYKYKWPGNTAPIRSEKINNTVEVLWLNPGAGLNDFLEFKTELQRL